MIHTRGDFSGVASTSCSRGRPRRRVTVAAHVVTTLLALIAGAGIAQASGIVGARAGRLVALSPQPSVATATAASLAGGADAATLTFDLSAAVTPTAFVLASPDRAIIDLPQVEFALPADLGRSTDTDAPGERVKAGLRGRPGQGDARGSTERTGSASGPGLVASYRFGLLAPGRSRIVIELGGPARIVSAAVRTVGGKVRLVIALARTDEAAFRAAAASGQPRQGGAVASAPATVAPTLDTSGLPTTIVLDPGHGGPDTGAIVNGVVEKDVALAFAKLLAAKLQAAGGFKVVLTRDSDVFIPLSERVRIARAEQAALMISIHADTLPETADVSGATVYTVSDRASDAYAATVAAKENAADGAVGLDGQADTADVNDILFDLTRQETRAYSHVFARTLVNYWKVAGRLNKNPRRAAGFVVLKAPDVPSVLLELGYLSSQADSAALTSADWREKATGRMAEAIVAYFADRQGSAKARAGVPIPLKQASADPSPVR